MMNMRIGLRHIISESYFLENIKRASCISFYPKVVGKKILNLPQGKGHDGIPSPASASVQVGSIAVK